MHSKIACSSDRMHIQQVSISAPVTSGVVNLVVTRGVTVLIVGIRLVASGYLMIGSLVVVVPSGPLVRGVSVLAFQVVHGMLGW